MLTAVAALFAVVATSVGAHLLGESSAGLLPGRWYREPGSPIHKLFARQSSYPPIDSPEWTKKYPAGKLSTAQTPKEWTDALNAAVSAGLITSNFPVASASGSYTNSSGTMNPANEPICSSAAECKNGDQTYNLPNGLVALSSDVPLPARKQLHAFREENNQKATYFSIASTETTWPCTPGLTRTSSNSPTEWSSPSLGDNADSSTGTPSPRYWRPSYDESDNRVRAIFKVAARLRSPDRHLEHQHQRLENRPRPISRRPQLRLDQGVQRTEIPCVLEHEFIAQAVQIFMETYPWSGKMAGRPKVFPMRSARTPRATRTL
ncbi:hypothetical protein FRC08_016353 [Ceratobasidium sp. 394]|nr:hypothetical protein FRC08_016353 [Ceratobasidium sp. 394]